MLVVVDFDNRDNHPLANPLANPVAKTSYWRALGVRSVCIVGGSIAGGVLGGLFCFAVNEVYMKSIMRSMMNRGDDVDGVRPSQIASHFTKNMSDSVRYSVGIGALWGAVAGHMLAKRILN